MTIIEIRPEEPGDAVAIHRLTEEAFGKRSVADLNDRLRENGKAVLSLIAAEDGRIVGHVMFAPVVLDPSTSAAKGVSLGPICVASESRGRGIMRRLVKAGLDEIRRREFDFAMLLGSPRLYPRFGFAPGVGFGLRSDYDVPDDEFMVLELCPGSLEGVFGVACFAPEFKDA